MEEKEIFTRNITFFFQNSPIKLINEYSTFNTII